MAVRAEHHVRLAVSSDLEEIRDSLVGAFIHDPVASWIYPDDKQRRVCLTEWYELTLLAGLRCGHTYTAASNRAAAVWAPPSVPQMFEWEREGVAITDMLNRHLGSRTRFVLESLARLEAAHPRQVPHFYLAMLGTSPLEQGRGLGGSLLDAVLGRCDDEGWPAYLETSLEKNVAFYARRRFNVTGETSLPDGPRVWFMWRDPQEASL
ncbi:MAG: GNAT family N-acetyltransferase [Acidimicrobiales bacterium]